MKNNRGFAVILIVMAIFVVGLAIGGLFYFLGSQNSKSEIPEPTPEEQVVEPSLSPSPSATPSDVSDSKDLNIIQGELDNTQVDSPDSDLKDVEKDASSF